MTLNKLRVQLVAAILTGMGRNRLLGAPYEQQIVTSSCTTEAHVDRYIVMTPSGGPNVTITLDPNAYNGDQVSIVDGSGNAGTHTITLVPSAGQTIDGPSTITTNFGSLEVTFSFGLGNTWLSSASGDSSGPTGATGATGPQGATGATGPGVSGTEVTITSGQTTTLLATDTAIIFDTSGGTTATADMIAPSFIGQLWTFSWLSYGASPVPPTINAPGGVPMVPFSGQSASGVFVSTTTISTPGASWTLRWNGTQLVPVSG